MNTRALHQLLNSVQIAAAPHLDVGAVEEVNALRVSAESLKKLATHFEEGLRIYEHHAIVGPWSRSLPPGLFDHPDESERLRHGIHRVELGHIHDGIGRTKRVGYVALAHHDRRAAVTLFVHHSASEADVETVHGPKNSWAELIVGCWEWAPQCRILRFSRDDRMNRSTAVWVRINDAVKARPGGRYYLADIEVDPHRDSWQGIILGQKSSEEVEAGKVRRLAGRLTKLASGAWPRGYVPVGLRLGQVEDVRGELRPDKSMGLETDPDQADEVTAVLEQYAAGVSKARIAVDQARRGARNGWGALLLPQVVPLLDDTARDEVRATLPALRAATTITAREQERIEQALSLPTNPTRREQATSAGNDYVYRILGGRRHLRTGKLDVMSFGAIAGRTDYHGWRPTFVTLTASNQPWANTIAESALGPDHPYWTLNEARQKKAQTHGFWLVRLQVGTVVQLPDATWEAIDQRIVDAKDTWERRATSGQARPLSGLKWRTDAGRFRIGQGGERQTYRINGPDGAHLHTVNATHAARTLGELLFTLVDRVDTAPLPLLPPASDSPQTRTSLIQQRLTELEAELSEIEARIHGLLRDQAVMSPDSRRYRLAGTQIDELEMRADALEEQHIPTLQAKLDHTSTDVDEPEWEETEADFAHLAVTAAALLRCDPTGPSALRDAVSWLLDHGRGLSNLRTGEHDRQVLIDVAVRIPLTDGSVGWIDAGTLDLTDRRVSATRKAEIVDDVARRLLRDHEPLDALTARHSWPATDLLVSTAGWLAEHTSLNTYLRAAAVTAAAAGGRLPVGPVIYARATGNAGALDVLRDEHGAWIVAQIEAAYLRPGASWAKNSGWVRNKLMPSRVAMAWIAQGGRARRHTLVAAINGLHNDEHLKDILRPGRRSFWQPPLTFDDGWVGTHRCRHELCPGGLGAPMTGFLPVPELIVTGDAVYCRHCWRTLTGKLLPVPYRELWDVGTDTSALLRGDGVPFVAQPGAVPRRGSNGLRTRDVAAALGLPMHQIYALVESGQLTATRTPGGKLVFDADVVNSPVIRRRYACTSVAAGSDADDRVTIRQAATLLGTSPMIVRLMSRTGAITNVGGGPAALYDRSHLDTVLVQIRDQTGRPDATMAQLATPEELTRAWGTSSALIRRLVAHGVLGGVTLGAITFVDRVSVDALADRQRRVLDPKARLKTREVAELAHLSPATVLHHVKTGALPAVQLIADNMVWFLREEVEAWLETRRG